MCNYVTSIPWKCDEFFFLNANFEIHGLVICRFWSFQPYVYLKIYTKVHSLFLCLLYCVKGKQNKVCIRGSIRGKRMTQKRHGSMQPFKNSHLSTSSNNCKVRSQMKKVRYWQFLPIEWNFWFWINTPISSWRICNHIDL